MRETLTISTRPGDGQRWKDKAWALRLSVSELIRRAVEAYDVQPGSSRTADSVETGAVVGPRSYAREYEHLPKVGGREWMQTQGGTPFVPRSTELL